jgi:23S rRNA (uracil1939-C5)-methyltransferase
MSQQLEITRLGHLGDGIANTPEGDVYVPFALPGEIVAGEVLAGRMANARIITPVAARIKPVCRHFRTCGGCAMQHASDDLLADWKTDMVQGVLALNGLAAKLDPIETSPRHSRRRAVFAGRRTKRGAVVGFHGRASGTLVEVKECPLVLPEIMAAVDGLRELCRLAASRRGEIRLAVTASDAGPDVDVTSPKQVEKNLSMAIGQLAGKFGFSRISWNNEVVVQRAMPAQAFGATQVVPPPGAFLQATRQGEAALVRAVKRAVGDARRLVDLFSGCGTFCLPLATDMAVHAVEEDAAMLAALAAGWRGATGLKPVTTEQRDLFRRPLLPFELDRYDAVVIDPPRAGARAQSEVLAQSSVPRIAFVACNPATFARDAGILVRGGYTLDRVQVVDQFRWSAHVELVALFRKTA